MGRISAFFLGFVVGAVACFGSLKYHVLRTDKGVAFVPKITASFSETYVDVRNFDAIQWSHHKMLAAAVVQAKRDDIFRDGDSDLIKDTFSKLLDGLRQ